ncbi:hypothetical protein [Clostridium scatologenes]|uniref:Uncharacterized protein n=1 Tax=Clostridium scatologenes TaxID=1548 RepID=A0A0E3MC07_CLOSL|nr:hypothetical protein [Clostridium scatologenes]AKA72053.1 hypothetical protein CSCA_4928 [Clostridium scatologenes]
MRISNKELFNIGEINNYIGKFEDKLQESNNKITQLKSDIANIETEIDKAFEQDILEGSTASKKELSNIQARKVNIEAQLDIEVKKALKIKDIMAVGLQKLIPEASNQIQADLQTYHNTVEKEIYRQLMEVRQKQEELLLGLQLAHNTVINELFSYDEICNTFGLEQYKKTASNEMFHNNLFMPHRSFPEYGSPLINCNYLPGIEDRLMRARAEVNAKYNIDRERMGLEEEQLPQAKTLQDIDLDKFLKELKSDGKRR